MGGDATSMSVMLGREAVAAGIGQSMQLLRSAAGGPGKLSDALELVSEAKQRLAALGGDDGTPVSIAGELLAARDDLGALVLSAFILDEVGVAEPVTRDLLCRGADRCYQRLRAVASVAVSRWPDRSDSTGRRMRDGHPHGPRDS